MIIEPCSFWAHWYHALVDVCFSLILTALVIYLFRHPEERSAHGVVHSLFEVAVVALVAGFGVSVYFCTTGH